MTAPLLFDEKLLSRRAARADPALKRFAGERLAAEVLERLEPVKRDFERVLVTGPVAAQAAEVLRAAQRFGSIEIEPAESITYDACISLIELQTLNDPVGRVIALSRGLKPDGLLLACLAGGATLNELRSAWLQAESETTGGVTPRVAPMADLRDMAQVLQRAGLAMPVADLDRTALTYANPLALMREIKGLGFSNPLQGRSRRPVTRGLLLAAAEAYPYVDGRIHASLELLWLTAWTPLKC